MQSQLSEISSVLWWQSCLLQQLLAQVAHARLMSGKNCPTSLATIANDGGWQCPSANRWAEGLVTEVENLGQNRIWQFAFYSSPRCAGIVWHTGSWWERPHYQRGMLFPLADSERQDISQPDKLICSFICLAIWTYLFFYLSSDMGVSKNRDTPKWMVYDGKPY